LSILIIIPIIPPHPSTFEILTMKQTIVSWLKHDSGNGPRWVFILIGLAIFYVLFIGERPWTPDYPVRR